MKGGFLGDLAPADPTPPGAGLLLLTAFWLYLTAWAMVGFWLGGGEALTPDQAIRLHLPVWLVTSLPLLLVAARRRSWAAFLGLRRGAGGLGATLGKGLLMLAGGMLLWIPLGQGWFFLLGRSGVDIAPQEHYRYLAGQIAAGRPDLLLLALVILVHPFFEELIFRGLIQGFARRFLARPGAIAVAALLFGLLHFPWPFVFPLFLLGLLFGYIRERSGSIWGAWSAHALFNGGMMALSPWMVELYGAY